MHPSRTSVALIAHSSTGDVASTTGQGYFVVAGPGFGCTSPDIWRSMNSLRSGRLRSDFVVMSRISSAAAN